MKIYDQGNDVVFPIILQSTPLPSKHIQIFFPTLVSVSFSHSIMHKNETFLRLLEYHIWNKRQQTNKKTTNLTLLFLSPTPLLPPLFFDSLSGIHLRKITPLMNSLNQACVFDYASNF